MKYFWVVVKHKYFVFVGGLTTKAPVWRLIMHDCSKFLPSEFSHYARQFTGKADQPEKFLECWLKHQNRNPHHWEYWIPRTTAHTSYLDNEPIPMPEWAVREMVADWIGAGRIYKGKYPDYDNWTWLNNHFPKIEKRSHPLTVERIRKVVNELRNI